MSGRNGSTPAASPPQKRSRFGQRKGAGGNGAEEEAEPQAKKGGGLQGFLGSKKVNWLYTTEKALKNFELY